MKLPNAHLAVVEQEKIAGYLLNPTHRYSASKARFFTGFGFRSEDWETLARALREHGKQHEVSIEREAGFGPRYELDGPLNTPDGRTASPGDLRRHRCAAGRTVGAVLA